MKIMGIIFKEIESVAYGIKWLLEDIKYEGLENRINCKIQEMDLEDICCAINYDFGTLDTDMLGQGMNGVNAGDYHELLAILSEYHGELEEILN